MSDKKLGRLRWKKNTPPRGLARVGYGPIGSKLTDGVTEYASVNAKKHPRDSSGWYWVAMSPLPWKNTCDTPCETESQAKKEAQEYVRAQIAILAERNKETPR